MFDPVLQFDEPLALYHGGVLRSPQGANAEIARRELDHDIETGLAALVAGTADQVAGFEPVPAAPVEVFSNLRHRHW